MQISLIEPVRVICNSKVLNHKINHAVEFTVVKKPMDKSMGFHCEHLLIIYSKSIDCRSFSMSL